MGLNIVGVEWIHLGHERVQCQGFVQDRVFLDHLSNFSSTTLHRIGQICQYCMKLKLIACDFSSRFYFLRTFSFKVNKLIPEELRPLLK